MKSWNEVKSDFHPDGSLRDLYVLNTNIAVWDHFLDIVKLSNYETEFIHGDLKVMPEKFLDIKAMQETDPTTLKIFIDNKTQVNCHFFTDIEIELDIDPSNINDERQYQNLIDFMSWLSDGLRKDVVLTHENSQDAEILKVIPNTN